jgi:hypothetical protein
LLRRRYCTACLEQSSSWSDLQGKHFSSDSICLPLLPMCLFNLVLTLWLDNRGRVAALQELQGTYMWRQWPLSQHDWSDLVQLLRRLLIGAATGDTKIFAWRCLIRTPPCVTLAAVLHPLICLGLLRR